MKIQIDVETPEEGEAIKRALAHPTTRATVIVTGLLLALPTDRERARVLSYVQDRLDAASN